MDDKMESNELQERQDVDDWLRWGCTLLGAVLVIGILIAVLMHMKDKIAYPKPVDIEAGLLFGIGIVLMILFNLPWRKIRIGEVEIERAIEEQTIGYAEKVEELKKVIEELEGSFAKMEEVPKAAKDQIESAKEWKVQEERDEELLYQFLKKWPTWGFTATRIRNWGGRQAGFEGLARLSVPNIRTLAASLLSQGKVRTRLSSSGSVLYQIR